MEARPVMRGALVFAAIVTAMLCIAAPASAARVYYTIEVSKPFASAPTLFVGVAPPGNRVGDPVVLSTRAGLNALQEWWLAAICYPGCPNEVTGGPGLPGRDLPRVYEIGFKLVSRYSGKCLSIQNASRANGAALEIANCATNARHQVWRPGLPPYLHPRPDIEPPGPAVKSQLRDYYSPAGVVAPNATTMRCLDVTNLRHTPGTQLQIWGCHNGWNQSLVLFPAVRDNRRVPTFVNP